MEVCSDEEEGRTFVQVVSEKYNPENFPCLSGFMMDVVVLSSPQSSPTKDRVTLPSALVLSGYGISKAGDEAELATFCARVVELDLSYNQLQDWAEICTIVSNIPHLDFLNLSMNPLSGVELEPSLAEVFSRVRRLVLINTHVSWDTVHTVTRNTPELEELFLCLNDFDSVSESSVPCSSLRLLQITDNQLRRWADVRKFGPMYPGLDTLVLANNGLVSVEEPEDNLKNLFPNLRSINLNNSGLSRWEDIERLNSFPKLEEVKVMGIPLLQSYTNKQRRSLVVAQLPCVSVLNASVVTDGEREDAERFYIRHYMTCPEEEAELPLRFHDLVARYGRLAPLAEVDLSACCSVSVEVRWGERVEEVSLRLDLTVSELKKDLRALVQLPVKGMRLFHMGLGPEEMKNGTRALHSYSIRDGDEILVVPRERSRVASSTSSDS